MGVHAIAEMEGWIQLGFILGLLFGECPQAGDLFTLQLQNSSICLK
jgi:hypothetical protein